MRVRATIGATAAALLAASAAAQPTAPQGVATGAPADAVALAQSCSAHKFETTVEFTVDGERTQSKVKMCGTVGQTDAQWATTLRDAASKVQANESMPQEARDQVAAAIAAELAKLGSTAASAIPATTLTLPRETADTAPPARGLGEYSALPPLPAPATVAATGSVAAASRPVLVPPRLTIRCMVPTELREPEPCAVIENNTQLELRADENLPAGIQLRFLRKGAIRGEVKLAAMRQGQTLRIRPPTKLCTGVLRSSTQIQILKAGPGAAGTNEVVDTRGPFDLRC